MQSVKRIFASGEAGQMSFDDAVAALQAIASDPKADPEEAETAKTMLEALATSSSSARRAKVSRALAAISQREEMNRRMGLSRAPTKASIRSGRTQTFPLLPANTARAMLKKDAAR